MQWDIKLDSNGDIDLSTGSMQLISDKKEAILQRFKLKFGTFTKEWFWKQSYGGIDRDLLFTKGVEQQILDAWFLSKIQEDPDVDQILYFSSSINSSTRSYDLTFTISVDDEVIEVTEQINQITSDSELNYPTSQDYADVIQSAKDNQVDVGTGSVKAVDYIYAVRASAPYFSIYRINPDNNELELKFQAIEADIQSYGPTSIGVNLIGTRVAIGYSSLLTTRFADVFIGSTESLSKIQSLVSPTSDPVVANKLIWNDDSNRLGVFNSYPASSSVSPQYGVMSYLFNPQLNFLSSLAYYSAAIDDPLCMDSDGRGGWVVGDGGGTTSALSYNNSFTSLVQPLFTPFGLLTTQVQAVASAVDGEFSLFGINTGSGIEVYRWYHNNIPESKLLIQSSSLSTIKTLSISYDKKYIVVGNNSSTVLIYKIITTGAVLLSNLQLPDVGISVSNFKWSKDSRRLYCKRLNPTNVTYNIFYYAIGDDGLFTYVGDITGANLQTVDDFDVVTKFE